MNPTTEFDYPVLKDTTVREFLLSFHLSKSKVYILFMNHDVLLNHSPCNENTVCKIGDTITILLHEDIDFIPLSFKLDILYEDSYFLIVNKPEGIIIHPEGKNETGTLVNMVAGYYKKMGYHLSVRFAHRLDKETTGVIVFCKDILTHSYMNYYISTHDIRREYRALVQGNLKNKNGRISLPIGCDRHVSGKMVISKTGKEAVTNYEELYSYKGYSLVRILLETGRTHQIRLHMSANGNPLLGDTLYGGQKRYISRVALHSYRISFLHPVTGDILTVTAPMPSDMASLMGGSHE